MIRLISPHSVPDGTGDGENNPIFYQHAVPDGTENNMFFPNTTQQRPSLLINALKGLRFFLHSLFSIPNL
ncbi:MAG: hypothetical protein LBG15_05120 [Dysgonamonadaceae bacterium]|jgi:hypothetical protein|nr:hypothetical protein [Dysgonamonadaceae bacterium]